MRKGHSPPNKGITKYGDVIDRINQMLESSPDPVEIKDIFSRLVADGVFQDTFNDYQKLTRILKTQRDNGRIDRNRVAKARGRKGAHPFKFKIGDKVRIDQHSERLPLELCERLRIDRPRTITAVFREPTSNTKTFYYLGSNRIGYDFLECYPFRVDMLVPYQKASKVGRPCVKRRYRKYNKGNHGGSQINACMLTTGLHQPLCV